MIARVKEGYLTICHNPIDESKLILNTMNCTRIGGHTYYQNIFIHGGCVHVQENKKEI